jgi:hypothetical protein
MRRKIWCDGWKRKYFGLGWGSEQGLSLNSIIWPGDSKQIIHAGPRIIFQDLQIDQMHYQIGWLFQHKSFMLAQINNMNFIIQMPHKLCLPWTNMKKTCHSQMSTSDNKLAYFQIDIASAFLHLPQRRFLGAQPELRGAPCGRDEWVWSTGHYYGMPSGEGDAPAAVRKGITHVRIEPCERIRERRATNKERGCLAYAQAMGQRDVEQRERS